MTDGQKIHWTLNLIQKLLDAKIGDPERLRIIKNTLENGNKVSVEEKNYLKEKFEELKNYPPKTEKEIDKTEISKNLIMVEKLEEAEIGNYDRLETMKERMANNKSLSKEDNEYLEEKYEQLLTIDGVEAKTLEKLDMVKKLQTAEIGNKEKLEKIQGILDERKELPQENEEYLQTKFEQYKKIQASNPTTSKTNPESKQTESPIKLGPFPDAKFCGICRKSVSPVRNMSTGAWILLLFIGIIPAIIYYLVKEKVCPICKHHQWEIPADDQI